MVRWVVVRVVLGFTITTVLTACGSGNVLESEAGGPPSFDPMATVSFAAPVRDVTMGVDDQHLTAVITDLPTGSDPVCRYELDPGVDESDPDVVRLNPVVVRTQASFTSCTAGEAALDVALGAPLAGRRVMATDATGAPGVYLVVDGALARCALPDCDPATGLPPTPANCDDGSLISDLRSGDVAQHADTVETRCDGEWAVVGVDVSSGACAPTEGGPKPCAGDVVTWYYLRAVGPQWQILTFGSVDGCGLVHEVEPTFPEALCADLRRDR